jgi:hypothetical protein
MDTPTAVDEAALESAASAETNTSNRGSVTAKVENVSSSQEQDSNQKALSKVQGAVAVRGRARRGPRTAMGKERSKGNALKHGIFSKVVILDFESPSEFNSLLRGLRFDLRPRGVLEEAIVEKLAVILWRHRRLLQAETAMVRENLRKKETEIEIKKAQMSDRFTEYECRMDELMAVSDPDGLISNIDSLDTLKSCLDKLRGVKMEVEKFGLDHETHPILLGRVYGARYTGRGGCDLFDFYLKCLEVSRATANGGKSNVAASQEHSLATFQDRLDQEIVRLESYFKELAPGPTSDGDRAGKSRETDADMLQCVIPASVDLDRLLRYEASLERGLERALCQLERIQKIRFQNEDREIPAEITRD